MPTFTRANQEVWDIQTAQNVAKNKRIMEDYERTITMTIANKAFDNFVKRRMENAKTLRELVAIDDERESFVAGWLARDELEGK